MNAHIDPPVPTGEVELSLYRPNVGVLLFNAEGRVWLGRRVNTPGPHNWQFPQGGVDKGEDLYPAALRELQEETGVVSVAWLGRTEGWITYDFPEGYKGSKIARGWRGQKQVWFALRFTGEDAEVNLMAHRHVEFDAWRWAEIDEAQDLVIPFKRGAYEQVIAAFRRFTDPAAPPDEPPAAAAV
ncbi:MAG TPA: RNA pyrophosphohydrolase [Caulobacteraceae bacterium]